MPLQAVAMDWGHTVMDECRDGDVPLDIRPIHLMPGVAEALPQLGLPLALWANTSFATESDLRGWLTRANLDHLFRWVITSVDAGARKPALQFFDYALAHCGLARDEVLFVGNQLNTDVAGAEALGIATVWLSGLEYRSANDAPCDAAPTYWIQTLHDLPPLVRGLRDR